MKLLVDIEEDGENIKSITIKHPQTSDASSQTSSFYDDESETDTEPDLDLIVEENKEMRVEIEKLNEMIRKLKVLLDL